MDILKDAFNDSVINKVLEVLDAECVTLGVPNGLRVTYAQVLYTLGYTCPEGVDDESKKARRDYRLASQLIATMLATGALKDYDIEPGPGGGIGRIGVDRPKFSKTNSTVTNYPDGFLDKLTKSVNELCANGAVVARPLIADHMGCPSGKTELLISKALKEGKLPGFASKAGAKGGIFKLSPVETKALKISLPLPIVNDEFDTGDDLRF